MFAFTDFIIPFKGYYDSWPLKLVYSVLPASVCSRDKKEAIIKDFFADDDCCKFPRGSSIAEAVLPSFRQAVDMHTVGFGAGATANMDFSQFCSLCDTPKQNILYSLV